VKTNSALAEMFFEFKGSTDDDPFRTSIGDDQNIVKDSSKTAVDTLGQITAYAAAHLGSQFRTHIYSVFIIRNNARLLQWDRAGAIVTAPFDYNQTHHLIDFLLCYSKAPAPMHGVDESVIDLSPDEKTRAREVFSN
jgi:hypothetical protein